MIPACRWWILYSGWVSKGQKEATYAHQAMYEWYIRVIDMDLSVLRFEMASGSLLHRRYWLLVHRGYWSLLRRRQWSLTHRHVWILGQHDVYMSHDIVCVHRNVWTLGQHVHIYMADDIACASHHDPLPPVEPRCHRCALTLGQHVCVYVT